ncbi:hypothetical protein [Nostoc commune]|uniref:hypothetical protein n=1 Tax=Nostoc commune TaxID=1178 RepID=UPI002074045B|nr:hypothetical protein [Nostoc commune]
MYAGCHQFLYEDSVKKTGKILSWALGIEHRAWGKDLVQLPLCSPTLHPLPSKLDLTDY